MKFQTGFTSANFLILFIFLSTTSAQTSAFSGYDTAGPYSAERIRDTGPDGTYDVFRPEFSGNEGEEHAIITWGNGTGATPTAYAGLLHHLATHGFVVIASQSTATGSGSEMAAGADWLLEENARTGSEYYQKLNSRAAGATGHSQGGAGTIQSLQHTDKITSIAPLAPATFDSPFFYSTSHVDVPMFIMLGSDDNLANPTSIRTMSWGTFESDKAGLYGELDGADHFEPGGDGGMFRKYVTAWFDATLNSSQDAVAMIFNTSDGALHMEPTEWSTLLHQNLDLTVPVKDPRLPAESMLTSEAKLERSELVLQVPHGEKLAVRVYDMKGVLVYHRVVERNNVLPVTTFVASGMYMIEVTEGRHTILNREMIIAR